MLQFARKMFIARSTVFYPGYFQENCNELSDEIILPSHTFNRLMDRFDDDEILYITLTNTETNQNYMVTMGNAHNYDKNTIYVPQWILSLIGCSGNSDTVIKIDKADTSEYPIATKIIIKPLDPVAFELDTVSCFEKAFMNLHSIKEGITMTVPVPQLGEDYIMYANIEKVEPEPVSRIVSGEVGVEFINEFEEKPQIPIYNPTIVPDLVSDINPVISSIPEEPIFQESAEERRQKVRESWLKRFQNNGESQ